MLKQGFIVCAIAILAICVASLSGFADENAIAVDREAYRDRLHGFWLGASIANWTGLPTENLRTQPPFFTDDDWRSPIGRGGEHVDFVLNNHPWEADDDTDIEYVYQKALQDNGGRLLTPTQIASAWQDHVGLPYLWVSNLAALGQMQNGSLPPDTSLPENNPMWDMIDAQLTTELLGALAPGRPDTALRMAHLPIRTTAYMHSEWAAEFYVIMHSLVALVDPTLSRAEQIRWMADIARKRVPEWSYIADMYDFVRRFHSAALDKDDWESARDAIYQRYQIEGRANYVYKYPWDAGINFASSIVSLLYGDGDYRRTIRIATLAGWDSDNPAATWGGLLGLLYGYQGLEIYFDKNNFSSAYRISRTRYNFPAEPDDFRDMATEGLRIIDTVVVEEMGGAVSDKSWIIPQHDRQVAKAAMQERRVPWQTIEDDDPNWRYTGFQTAKERWNASGATLTTGAADCLAEIVFRGTAVQYYAYRSAQAGTVTVTIDGQEPQHIDLSIPAAGAGQYFAKVFDQRDLTPSAHRLEIACDSSTKPKHIDMLSIVPLPTEP